MTSTNETKDLVFISHANNEDNYFAAWLAAKLNVLGYNAWVDVDDFNAGDAFFTTIHPLIKEKAIRFVAVNSEAYLAKAADQNSGVSRELNTAITVKDVENFIIPIRIEDVDFNDFPSHYASWNAIDFLGNWQAGLIALVKQFEKLDVPITNTCPTPIDNWFRAIKNENRVIKKEESYYTNWFPFDLPEYTYVHYGTNIEREKYYSIDFPSILEANRLISFFDEDTANKHVDLSYTKRFVTNKLLAVDEIVVDDSFTLIEPRKKIVKLLNQCFKSHLAKSDLSYWRKRNLNYFLPAKDGSKSVSLRKRYGKGSRTLTGIKTTRLKGKRRTIQWHFAIRPVARLHPFPFYELTYTLVFTDERGKGMSIEDGRTLRRSVPADWFNRKWHETVLAAMLKLSNSDESEHVSIPLGENSVLKIDNQPFGGVINVGYIEP